MAHIVMALHSYGSIQLWPFIGMALYSCSRGMAPYRGTADVVTAPGSRDGAIGVGSYGPI